MRLITQRTAFQVNPIYKYSSPFILPGMINRSRIESKGAAALLAVFVIAH